LLYPSVDQLLEKMDSKYSLVVVVARRARQLKSDPEIVKFSAKKPIVLAMEEVINGTVRYKRLKEGDLK